MLAVDNISVQFLGRVLYKGLSFTVSSKDRSCFAGPNGAGKSTLMKIIAGTMNPDSGNVNRAKYIEVGYLPQDGIEHSGSTLFDEAESAFENALELKERLEEASEQLGSLDTSSSEYAETLEIYGELQLDLENYDIGKMKPTIEKVLSGLGFKTNDFNRKTEEFSGGWQMRIALAKLLLQKPSILLLDEPTNHLDMVTRNVVENALIQFTGSIVCISHDRHFLNNVTNLTCEIGGGDIRIFEGNNDYYEWKKQSETSIESNKPKVKNESKGKSDFKARKRTRNRLAWIEKRFKSIELELEEQKCISQDLANGDDYEFLQKTMETMSALENEYLKLMEEQEGLYIKNR